MQAVASSQGLFAYDRFTAADYNLTARTPDGSGSGWASKSFNELRLLQPGALAEMAIDKAAMAKNPSGIEPGKYTVVLEPAALADLLVFMLFSANARQAD
jgi:predicted Zn-dependent protease